MLLVCAEIIKIYKKCTCVCVCLYENSRKKGRNKCLWQIIMQLNLLFVCDCECAMWCGAAATWQNVTAATAHRHTQHKRTHMKLIMEPHRWPFLCASYPKHVRRLYLSIQAHSPRNYGVAHSYCGTQNRSNPFWGVKPWLFSSPFGVKMTCGWQAAALHCGFTTSLRLVSHTSFLLRSHGFTPEGGLDLFWIGVRRLTP